MGLAPSHHANFLEIPDGRKVPVPISHSLTAVAGYRLRAKDMTLHLLLPIYDPALQYVGFIQVPSAARPRGQLDAPSTAA
jgi:hypothetical protein